MKILVAGGAGYIGSALVPELIACGHQVTVIDLLWFGTHLPKGVRVIKKNLFACTHHDFKGFDQIVFLAGISNDPMAEYNPAKNFIYNAALPSFIAYEAKKANVKRFILSSSCSVYGYTVGRLYNEKSPTSCLYPYGISKLQGEKGVLQLIDKSFSVIALRKGTVCGYSPRMRMDLIVNTMFKTALQQQRIVINNPDIWRPICDIRDIATAYACAIQAPYPVSGIFNIASGNYTVGHVGNIVKNELERHLKKPITITINAVPDARNYKVSVQKAKSLLRFTPVYTIKDTVADLYEKKHYFNDFANPRYYNVKVFKKIENHL